ncbi:periplasmic heavy metal sensor [bacterium]|nr:periplasmic heavy metal sensor [bacterium]
MKRKLGVLAVTALACALALAIAIPASAQPFEGKRHGPPQVNVLSDVRFAINHLEAAKEAGVTDEQVTRLQAILDDHRAKAQAARQAAKQAQKNLDDVRDEPEFDVDRFLRVAEELAKSKEALLKQRIETEVKVREVLTREQIDKLQAAHPRGLDKRMHRGGPPRMAPGMPGGDPYIEGY